MTSRLIGGGAKACGAIGAITGAVTWTEEDDRDRRDRDRDAWDLCRRDAANFRGLVLGARAVRIPDKSSKTDGTGSSLPDLDKKTVTLRSLD